MSLMATLVGRARGTQEVYNDLSGGKSAGLVINPRGDLAIAQTMPGIGDLVRMRNSFFVIQSTAVAPIVALPTTTAQLTLFNGEQDGGRSYVIDSVGAIVQVSAAAATAIAVLACMGTGRKTAPTSDLTPRGLAGHRYKGAGIVDINATITNDTWHICGSSTFDAPTSQIGMAVEKRLDGLYVVPPGHYFSIAAITNTAATITVRHFIRWHEVLVQCSP